MKATNTQKGIQPEIVARAALIERANQLELYRLEQDLKETVPAPKDEWYILDPTGEYTDSRNKVYAIETQAPCLRKLMDTEDGKKLMNKVLSLENKFEGDVYLVKGQDTLGKHKKTHSTSMLGLINTLSAGGDSVMIISPNKQHVEAMYALFQKYNVKHTPKEHC